MTYLKSFFKSQILGHFTQNKSLVRNASIQQNLKVKKLKVKQTNKSTHWISPPLTTLRIQEIESVTGIVMGLNYITWLKMSVPELIVLDWSVKILPADFGKQKDESSLLALAYDIRNSLPQSDLYIMESLPLRETKLYIGINKLQLSSMLSVLLNGFNTDKDWKGAVIFQKKHVMNYMYNIQIASERISTKSIVENILLKSTYLANDCDLRNNSSNIMPSIKVDNEYVEIFKQSELEKQEYLSLALLLTLSFIDVNLFRNPESIAKIQKRKKYD